MTVAEQQGRHSAIMSPVSVPTTARADGIAQKSARTIGRPRQTGHFLLHFLEMCAPMCIGFALGDLVYFWAAEQQGYSEP
ncbi:MAG: hypothetical protein ACRDNP_13355, partial [Gaiellaceae bacterium]